jgi:aryl sulfotransferase
VTLCLIASYPKSGNTWVRCIVQSLLQPDEPLDINRLAIGSVAASSRMLLEQELGIDPAALSADEIGPLRQRLHRRLAAQGGGTRFLKLHDANLDRLIPAASGVSVIYVVRDPVDVAASYAAHAGLAIDRIIDHMADDAAIHEDYLPEVVARGWRLAGHMPQRLSSWHGHVASFVDAFPGKMLTVSYERLHSHGPETIAEIAGFLAIPHDSRAIELAHAATRFERLREQESRADFAEAPARAAQFFREGRVGGGRAGLSREQIERIHAAHGGMMRRLGYLR